MIEVIVIKIIKYIVMCPQCFREKEIPSIVVSGILLGVFCGEKVKEIRICIVSVIYFVVFLFRVIASNNFATIE